MRYQIFFFLVVSLFCLNSLAFAQRPWTIFESRDFQPAAASPKVSVQQKGTGFQVSVSEMPENPWDAQLISRAIPIELKKGDAICLELDAVTATTADGIESTLFVFFQDTKTYGALNKNDANHPIYPKPAAEDYRVVVRADRDCPVGTINVVIHCAGAVQDVNIADVRVTFLGSMDDSQLPVQSMRYGKELVDDIALREARERIEKVRKSNLQLKVLNAANKPVSGVKVELKQLKHAYAFGSFTDAQPLKTGEPDTEQYRREMKAWFNRVTLPRYFADWGTDSEKGRLEADAMMQWAASEGFELKTHVLLYPKFLPPRVMELTNTPEAFRRELDNAIADALQRTQSTPMAAWDAINELRDSDAIGEVLGQKYYAELFNRANKAQPKAKWFINEYGIVAGHAQQEKNIIEYERKIQSILDNGGQIEGIGIQGHFQQELTSMSKVKIILDRFAKFGLPIEITEFDIDTRDEQTQAEYTRDFLTMVFSHPATTGLTTWGFWEGSMWRPRGAMIRKDWTVKPNGKVWRSLIYDEWWTRAEAETDSNGVVQIRAFRGTHELKITKSGKTMTRRIELQNSDKELVVRIGRE